VNRSEKESNRNHNLQTSKESLER